MIRNQYKSCTRTFLSLTPPILIQAAESAVTSQEIIANNANKKRNIGITSKSKSMPNCKTSDNSENFVKSSVDKIRSKKNSKEKYKQGVKTTLPESRSETVNATYIKQAGKKPANQIVNDLCKDIEIADKLLYEIDSYLKDYNCNKY
jgi:hypothetical protein